MKQILNIFRKDARHRWIEIAASLALLVLYAWRESKSWGPARSPIPDMLDFLWGLTVPLVPIVWAFLIVRVVHDESLVGDRQFWVTRPYEWEKLLAAKLLFVAAFINLPLLIVDVVLLAKAGFHPWNYLLGLLWMQLLLTLSMTLSVAAAAVITSSIGQVLLVVVVVFMYLIGGVSLVSKVPNSGISAAESIPTGLAALVFLGACTAAVTSQYARRQTWKTRVLLVIAPIVVLVILVAMPYRLLVERAYPVVASGQPGPVVLSLGPAADLPPKRSGPLSPGKTVTLLLPLRPGGVGKDSILAMDGTKFIITAADGTRWSSGWLSGGGGLMWPDRENESVAVEVPARFFDRAKGGASKMEIFFALSVYREENFRSFEVPEGEFRSPGVGVCAPTLQGSMAILQCRSAMKEPAVIASFNTSAQTCPQSPDKPPPPPGIRLTAERLEGSSGPAELGISPIQTFTLYFRNWMDPIDKFAAVGPCPGTPLTFSTPVLVQQVRTRVQFEGLRLEDYAFWSRGTWSGESGFVIR